MVRIRLPPAESHANSRSQGGSRTASAEIARHRQAALAQKMAALGTTALAMPSVRSASAAGPVVPIGFACDPLGQAGHPAGMPRHPLGPRVALDSTAEVRAAGP